MWTRVLIAAVLCILVILLAWWMRDVPIDTMIQQSAGTFDQHARRALVSINNIHRPTPMQRVQRARLIRYNVLEGRADDPLMNVVRDDLRAAAQDIAANPHADNIAVIDLMGDELEVAMLFAAFFGGTTKAQEKNAQARMDAIRAEATTPAHAVVTALQTPIPSDSQNVHEGKVTQHGRDTYALIYKDIDEDAWADSFEQWIGQYPRAQPCARVMLEGNPISTYNCTERDILLQTWHRIHDERNRDNFDNLCDALCDALVDASSPTLVCANGRCSRVLGSLALLDFDPNAGSAVTLSAYKADIMRVCADEFDKLLAKAETAQPTVYAWYLDDDLTPDPVQHEQFKTSLRDIIDNAIAQHAEHLSKSEQDTIKRECEVYMTIT